MEEDDYPITSSSSVKKEATEPKLNVLSKPSDFSFPDDTSDRKELLRAVVGEFLGMTMFVFLGCGSVAATGEFLVDDFDLGVKVNVARVLPIATCFGLSITVLAFNLSAISGGHLNPGKLMFIDFERKLTCP